MDGGGRGDRRRRHDAAAAARRSIAPTRRTTRTCSAPRSNCACARPARPIADRAEQARARRDRAAVAASCPRGIRTAKSAAGRARTGSRSACRRELFDVLDLFDQWRTRSHGVIDPAAQAVIAVWTQAAAEQRLPTETRTDVGRRRGQAAALDARPRGADRHAPVGDAARARVVHQELHHGQGRRGDPHARRRARARAQRRRRHRRARRRSPSRSTSPTRATTPRTARRCRRSSCATARSRRAATIAAASTIAGTPLFAHRRSADGPAGGERDQRHGRRGESDRRRRAGDRVHRADAGRRATRSPRRSPASSTC